MHFLPIWNIATNSAHRPCCCHVITNTCHLITHTCCLPNEMVVWWQRRVLLCSAVFHPFRQPVPPTNSDPGGLKSSIFSFFLSNECVTHLAAKWPAGRDPYLPSWAIPTASHLACLLCSERWGCTVASLMIQGGVAPLKGLIDEEYY